MEEFRYVDMGNRGKIMRRSIFTFLQYYECFTITPILFILPFSASILLSQSSSASSFPSLLNNHAWFKLLFNTLGFSSTSHFLSLRDINLSPTIFASVFSLLLGFTFLLTGKLLIVQSLIHQKPKFQIPFSSFTSLYKPLFLTQLCNSVLIIIINITTFSILFTASNTLEAFGFTTNNPLLLLVSKAVFYSILANACVIFNLALVVAGWENCTGFAAIHKACLLSGKRNSIVFSMNLPINLGMIAVEGLFRYRLVRADDHITGRSDLSLAMEGLLIAYLYSLLIVLDTIASCLVFNSTKENIQTDYETGRYCFQIKIVKREDRNSSASHETSDVLP